MALAGAARPVLSGAKGIGLVVQGLEVLPTAGLVLHFDVDAGHGAVAVDQQPRWC